jgi:hypothetical protein
MGMITKEAQRIQVMRRLCDTRRNETLCLWGWETEVIIDYINELKGRITNGNQKTLTADSQGQNAGDGV